MPVPDTTIPCPFTGTIDPVPDPEIPVRVKNGAPPTVNASEPDATVVPGPVSTVVKL